MIVRGPSQQVQPEKNRAKSRPPKALDLPVPALGQGLTADTVQFSRKPAQKAASVPVRFGAGPQDPDFRRYHDILKELARQDLKQFKSPQDFEVSKDGKSVKLPQDYIDTPRFTRGGNEGAVGQGEGDPGDEVGEVGQDGQPQPAKPGDEPGEPGEPGDEPGEGEEAGEDGAGDLTNDEWNLNVSRMEIADWIGDGLELPNFEPRGDNNIQKILEVPKSIDRVGRKEILRKTLMQAIKRTMASQGEDFDLDEFIRNFLVQKPDFRYVGFRDEPIPKENAVIFYIIDTSGSMGEKEKKIARDTNFYLSTYLQAQYGKINAELRGEQASEEDFGNGVEEVFITHDTEADQVSEKEFYTKSKGSATNFSPAYEKVKELIEEKYPLDQWNVYVFHYTDGDNAGRDNEKATKIIEDLVEKGMNLFGYIETAPRGGSWAKKFKGELEKLMGPDNKYVRSGVAKSPDPEEYRKVVRQMLGKEEERAQMANQKEDSRSDDWDLW